MAKCLQIKMSSNQNGFEHVNISGQHIPWNDTHKLNILVYLCTCETLRGSCKIILAVFSKLRHLVYVISATTY